MTAKTMGFCIYYATPKHTLGFSRVCDCLTYTRCTLRLACETNTGVQHRLRHSSALEFGINYDTTRHVQGGGGGVQAYIGIKHKSK